MRTPLALATLLVALGLAPALADADALAPTGLLWKHRHDGTLNGWTAVGPSQVGIADDPTETMIHAWSPWYGAAEMRSPSLPLGTRRLVLDIVPESAWDDLFITARDVAGTALLTVFSTSARLCVGSTCSPRDFVPANLELDIRIEPSGWSLRHDGILFASGPDDLGVLDHVTLRGTYPNVRDARAYGLGGHVDAALRTDFGGFIPFVDRLDGGVLPQRGEPWSFSSFGLIVNANDALRQRTLVHAELHPGPWAFQTHVTPVRTEMDGYAVLAGLDAGGGTLWRVEVDRVGPTADIATLHFREGDRSTHVMDLSARGYGWNAWIAAHGDPATGLLSLRVRNDALPPIAVASLDETAALAFGDATSLAPETASRAPGAGRMLHIASFVASVPAGYEV